jgi:hypothetical protein
MKWLVLPIRAWCVGQVLDRAVAMREQTGITPPAVLNEEANLRRQL